MHCTPSASHGRLTLGSVAGQPSGFFGCVHRGLTPGFTGVGVTGVGGTGVGMIGVGFTGVGFTGVGFTGVGRVGVGFVGLGRGFGVGVDGASTTTAGASIGASATAASMIGGAAGFESLNPKRTTTTTTRIANATHAANARLNACSW